MKICSLKKYNDCRLLLRIKRKLHSPRDGQSLIEACLAIFLIGLIFTGIYQVSRIYIAKELLSYAASRSARAETVGFNHFMATKAAKVAVIPSSGRLINRGFVNNDPTINNIISSNPGLAWDTAVRSVPSSQQADFEKARIPSYLESRDQWQSLAILDYEYWDNIDVTRVDMPGNNPDSVTPLHMRVTQQYELKTPLHRAFYDGDAINLESDSYIENHYLLYIDPQINGNR